MENLSFKGSGSLHTYIVQSDAEGSPKSSLNQQSSMHNAIEVSACEQAVKNKLRGT